MYLSVPPEIARTLPPDLADLVGYTQADYVLGYFSMPDPFGTELAPNVLGSDTLPPEAALGRMPSRAKKEVKL